MNKRECEKALERYIELFERYMVDYCVSKEEYEEIHDNIKCIEKLIEKHFDNSPLEFEDLKEDNWIWVKKLNGYFKINSVVDLTEENDKRYVDFGFGYIEFKEDMFYRKEVKENGKD